MYGSQQAWFCRHCAVLLCLQKQLPPLMSSHKDVSSLAWALVGNAKNTMLPESNGTTAVASLPTRSARVSNSGTIFRRRITRQLSILTRSTSYPNPHSLEEFRFLSPEPSRLRISIAWPDSEMAGFPSWENHLMVCVLEYK